MYPGVAQLKLLSIDEHQSTGAWPIGLIDQNKMCSDVCHKHSGAIRHRAAYLLRMGVPILILRRDQAKNHFCGRECPKRCKVEGAATLAAGERTEYQGCDASLEQTVVQPSRKLEG